MSLSSAQLDAFYEVSRLGSFSKAALALHVTQSALSQRIAQLEYELQTSLFIREPSGIRLTEIGEELLRYCKTRSLLEQECVSRIKADKSEELVGVLRIAAYSTITRSIVLPAVGEFLDAHRNVRFDIVSKEMRDLPLCLKSGEVDFIFVDRALENEKVHSIFLGYEEYVLIESKSAGSNESVYLDHDNEDQTTKRFFDLQTHKPKLIERSFVDEIYAIIASVALGLGRAVVPLHLIEQDRHVRQVLDLQPMLVPVYLCFWRQPVYTRLNKEVASLLEREVKLRLRNT